MTDAIPTEEVATTTRYLSAQDILTAQDIDRAEVDCHEWGGIVLVRGMTATERGRFDDGAATAVQKITQIGGGRRKKGQKKREQKAETEVKLHASKMRLQVVTWCAIAADGSPLFSALQLEELGKKNDNPVRRCYEKILELSGVGEEEEIEGE
jgi:hypothetical protein